MVRGRFRGPADHAQGYLRRFPGVKWHRARIINKTTGKRLNPLPDDYIPTEALEKALEKYINMTGETDIHFFTRPVDVRVIMLDGGKIDPSAYGAAVRLGPRAVKQTSERNYQFW